MDDLNDQLAKLDDAAAERILAAVTRHRLNTGEAARLPLVPELGRQLADDTRIAPVGGPVSNGDLARASLLLLAAEPSYQPALRAFVSNPPAQDYADPLTVILVGTAALAVLQTCVKVERDAKGKWTFHFSKEPSSNPLLKSLITAFCGYLLGK
jgi:hypothetical protein